MAPSASHSGSPWLSAADASLHCRRGKLGRTLVGKGKFPRSAKGQQEECGTAYRDTRPWVMAYFVNSAVVWRSSCAMIRDLWNSTVLLEILRRPAISLIERPSATSWSTSRWRGGHSPRFGGGPGGRARGGCRRSFAIKGET